MARNRKSRLLEALVGSVPFMTATRAAFVILAALLPVSAPAQITIIPAAPKALESVRIEVPSEILEAAVPRCDTDARQNTMSMSGNRITVTVVDVGRQPTNFNLCSRVIQPLGQLPAGDYSVDVKMVSTSGQPLATVGSATFAVRARWPGEAAWNFTDLWWDPAESGWGLNIVQHSSGVIFATWFVYGSDGTPVWYVAPDVRTLEGSSFQGSVYRTTGPEVCLQDSLGGLSCPPFDPAAVTRTHVGSVGIGFWTNTYDFASVIFSIDGKVWRRVVQRQGF